MNQEAINQIIDLNDTLKIILIIQSFALACFVGDWFIRGQQKRIDEFNKNNSTDSN